MGIDATSMGNTRDIHDSERLMFIAPLMTFSCSSP